MDEIATEEAPHNHDSTLHDQLSSPVKLCLYILGIWTPEDSESHSNGSLDDNDNNRLQSNQQHRTEDDAEKQRLLNASPRTKSPQFSGTTIFALSLFFVLFCFPIIVSIFMYYFW